MLITILIFIAVLFVLVMVHEAGHFFASRKFGVKVDEFGFGIPPRLFGWRRKTADETSPPVSSVIPVKTGIQTETQKTNRSKSLFVFLFTFWIPNQVGNDKKNKYEFVAGNKEITPSKNTLFSLNLLPIGGFVRIKGENEETSGPDSFSSQKAWKRTLILASGVFGNIALACFIFIFLFAVGSEMYIPEEVDLSGAKVSNQSIKIVSVAKGSPAELHGLTSGDTLVSLDGRSFENVAAVREYIQESKDRSILIRADRGSERVEKQIQPQVFEGSGDKALLGINMARNAFIRYSIPRAVLKGFEATFVTLYQIVKGLVTLIGQAVSGEKISGDVAGPVGIAVMTGQAARLGILYIFQFMALLSLNLAIINIIPFPALDGGRILFILLEKVRRKKMRTHVEQWANTIGFSLLLLLILWVTVGDVTKLQVVKNFVEGVKNIF